MRQSADLMTQEKNTAVRKLWLADFLTGFYHVQRLRLPEGFKTVVERVVQMEGLSDEDHIVIKKMLLEVYFSMPYITQERGEELLEAIEYIRKLKEGRQLDMAYGGLLDELKALKWHVNVTGRADTVHRLESKIKRGLRKQKNRAAREPSMIDGRE